MAKLIDVKGLKFNRLTVLSRAENDSFGQAQWNCLCDCGNKTIVRGIKLRNNNIKSCGCLRSEKSRERMQTHGLSRKNGEQTRLYKLYHGMRSRCYNPNDASFDRYGESGITVCDEWLNDYMSFHNWAMANGYKNNLTLDRIDNAKGYSPDNCRWATRKTQSINRRCVIQLTYKGVTKTVEEWSKIVGLNPPVLRWRHSQGWSDEEVLWRKKYEKHTN